MVGAERASIKGFDPFSDRLLDKAAITDLEVLIHLLKATLGTGILSMPIAFKYSGLLLGIGVTILTGLICGHCAYILVKSAHRLYYREQKKKMNFAEISESAFLSGPECLQKMAAFTKWSILALLFVTYFGSCSVYAVIIAKNFQQVLEHWADETYNLRLLIVLLLVPFILLAWIPNLKGLAPVSLVANLFMACGLVITFYYLLMDIPSIKERDYVQFSSLPAFFAITIFAMEAIGVIMPLENSMRTPTHFLGYCGVMTQGMIGVTSINILLGFLGYLRYGPDTEETITLNLPVKELPAQLVKVLIGLGIYCTFALQFTVCLEIAWDGIKDKFSKRPLLANYVLRTFLVVSAVGLAIAVPTIAPFMGLIGAFCFSSLGLIMPAVIEMVLDLETGYGRFDWLLWKNIFILGFGIFALIFGSRSAIQDIMELYE